MDQFNSNPRRQQEIITRPIWVFLLKQCYPSIIDVSFDISKELDKERGIDLSCQFDNGMVIYGQTKTLSYNQSRFASVTVEYMNNPRVNEEGDWFSLGCQIYCCGYCSKALDKLVNDVRSKLKLYQCFDIDSIAEISQQCGIDNLIEQEEALINWVILDWYKVIEATQKGLLNWHHNKNKRSGLADFKYVFIRDLLTNCIIATDYFYKSDKFRAGESSKTKRTSILIKHTTDEVVQQNLF